ncbi:MAG: 30S ribosomal protein S12 methylthiotransferase RimO [Candidatus Kryptoniota bacterium]
MRKNRVHITTLGCPKNQVDSEVLAAQLMANGYSFANSSEEADIAVINTCGFIDAAKQESIETILKIAQQKKSGHLKKLIVTGCLVERYRNELKKDLREVDAFFGTNELGNVLTEFRAEYKYEMLGDRVLSTPGHYAYLKISEGCDNPCSFCAIPLMRGRHVSKTIEEIIHEAELLAEKGVKELIIVGQDTTYYGLDIYGKRELPRLMSSLNEVKDIEWIRLMYAYPAKFPEEVLDIIRDSEKICKYIDIPIQHVSDSVLKSMRRGITRRKLEDLLYQIRKKIPEIAIRSTLIVGYPSEGEKEFDELLQFVNEFKFERLGAFTYSVEDGTTAAILGDPIPQDEKERRHAVIMEAQRKIIAELNGRKIGKTLRVLVDKKAEDNGQETGKNFVGRTNQDAPEIDSEVVITSHRNLAPGSFVNATINDAYEHDLYGTAN